MADSLLRNLTLAVPVATDILYFVSDPSGTPADRKMVASGFVLSGGLSGGQTLIGGTGTTDDLILRSTAGVGAAGADIIFQVGNNGATEAMRILNSGLVGIGVAGPTLLLTLVSTGALGWDNGSGAAHTAAFYRDTNASTGGTANVALRDPSGANSAQRLVAYRSYVDASNWSRVALGGQPGGNLRLFAENTGTEGPHALEIGTSAEVEVSFYANNAERVRITTSGSVGIGTTLPYGGTTGGTKILSLGNGTAPVGGRADQVSLYSADVAASAELFALDEAGNTPQLSPHPGDLLDTLPSSATGPYAYPWAYSASNAYLGKKIQVDLAGVVAAVEQLIGKTFAVVTDLPPGERANWDDDQESQRTRRQAEIDDANQRRSNLDARIAAEPNLDKKTELQKQRDGIKVPQPYVKKRPPKWMQDRGVTSGN